MLSHKLPSQLSNDQPPQSKVKEGGFWKKFDWWLMCALVIPVTLETLDYTVVATAQPRIASVFNALNLQSYIGTSYLLASTVFLPFFASIADIYGRHFGLQLSLLFFLVGSAFSTGAVNMTMLLAGRGIAGIGAAGLLTVYSSSLDTNNIQQSAMFFLYSLGFCIGPVIGGFLVTASFRWVFAINLPCVALAMILCFFLLRKRVKGAKSSEELPGSAKSTTWIIKLALIDWIGTFLFVIGGVLILLALNWGPDDDWKTVRVIVCLVIGVIVFVACILWEVVLERKHQASTMAFAALYHVQPMLPLELFRSYDICVLQYGCFVSGIVMFVMFYFVAIFMTIVSGLSPDQAGIQLLYFAPGIGAGSLVSIRLIKRFRQPIYPIIAGLIVMTVGLGLIQMGMQKNVQGLVNGFMCMTGFGVGLTASPNAVQARFLMPDHVAVTNALLLFFRALGGTVGLAQCFTVMNAKVNSYIVGQIRSGAISGSDLNVLEALYNSGGLDSIQSLDGLPPVVQQIIRDAFRNGVRWSFISLIPWAGLAVILSLFLSKIPDPDAQRTDHDEEMELSEQDDAREPSDELEGDEHDDMPIQQQNR
ncbi:major facilitator superfamily domain-containing protein [Suillus subalutaceus]|uniref:major facilitator superfamily domain-containing protein n=1 Tax=Suillus subalutaceus TaxID=48586 RepID=UPI001B880C11|nr:major facilitator superfamily domain-containing protein [Suillus subalutaceus]KAG1855642.1 major facilitator superfamily domain-containing protein [Suillus subalutaceus]